MLRIATAPAYSTIASGLDPAQTGKITAALDEQGIAYELQQQRHGARRREGDDGAGAHRARRPGRRGDGGGAQPGYELFDKQKLGASEFQQKVTYQRALEGEIASTLSGVAGRLERPACSS